MDSSCSTFLRRGSSRLCCSWPTHHPPTTSGPGRFSAPADTGNHQDPAGHGLDALELLAARCEAAATGAAVVTVAADHHAPGPTAVDAEAAAGRVAEARAHLTDGGAG